MYVIELLGELQCSADNFLRSCPFADQQQVDAEIVISNHRVEGVIGLIKELDRFFKTSDSVVRAAKEPVCTGHIHVELAEHEWRRVTADDLYTKLEIFDGFFRVAFVMKAQRDLAIALGHPEPVAPVAKVVQCLLGIITSYGRFIQFSV